MIDSYCGLCGAQEHLTRTGCCNRPICDDVHKYKPMSYSLVSCYRNHERYTVCAYHKKEGHDGNDWRQCAACRTSFADTLELFAGQGTSHHNFADDKWKAPTFEPTCCWKCGRVIKLNSEGYTNHTRCGVKECSDCDFVPKNQIRHSLVCCHGMWASMSSEYGQVISENLKCIVASTLIVPLG